MPATRARLADRLRAELTAAQDRIDALTAEGDRLERSLGRALEANRALSVLLERAEQDRDTALQRLSTAAYEATDWRRQLAESRALLQRFAAEQEGATP